VEQSFLEVWRKFSKTLKQRNAALRQGEREVIESIDEVLSQLGSQLSRLREAYSRAISKKALEIVSELSVDLSEITLEYQNGWGLGDYIEALEQHRGRDMERGNTSQGPHRADLVIMTGGANARAVLSRGQQKTLSAALLLAQAEILKSNGVPPLVLLDDLASEFDGLHFKRVLAKFIETGGQVWVTGTVKPELTGSCTVFHVKHGKVHEMI
jgi:DNA replication and repair protein RecF